MKIEAIIELMNTDRGIKTVTKYVSPKDVIRVTRQHPKNPKRGTSQTYLVSVGKPNYEARQFIKLCKQAGEPFPVKRPQIKRYPIKGKINVSKSKIHLP